MIFVEVPSGTSSAHNQKPEREGDADLSGNATNAGKLQVAGVEFTNGDQPGVRMRNPSQ
jgi:hypothetical protein